MFAAAGENRDRFIGKLYIKALIPNVIAVLGGTINVFFDGVFIGRKLGDVGLQSVNQCLPVYLLLCTLGSLYASGASFMSSHAIGRNDVEEGRRLFQGVLWEAFAVGLLFCLLGLWFSPGIAGVLSSGPTYEYVCHYLRITLIGGVAKVLLYVPYFYLRLEGKNIQSMSAMLTMTVLNIVLDALFLFGFDFGIRGAAWASVIATVVAAAMSFAFLFSGDATFLPGKNFLRMPDRLEIYRYGSPMALNNILSAARIFVLNLILGGVGGGMFISVFAIANNLNELSICVQNGVPQTGAAMTGIFYGEKDSKSLKAVIGIEIASGIVLSLLIGVTAAAMPVQIGRFFGSSADCTFAIRAFAVSLIFATVNSVMTSSYSAVGRLREANVITVSRGFIAMAGFALMFRGLGDRIWLFYPCAEAFTFLLILAMGHFVAKKNELVPFYLIDDELERRGQSTSFSVECDVAKICEASDKIKTFCDANSFTKRETMAISLAIEELLTIITDKSCPPDGFMEVRVLTADERRIIRVRSAGKRYNPIEAQDGSLDYMGVKMICGMARQTEYLSTLGVNTLIIYI